MAKGTTPLNKVPRSWAGGVVCDTNAIGTGAVTANELANGAVGTAQISANRQAQRISIPVPTIPTTGGPIEVNVLAPSGGQITGGFFTAKDALAQSDTNFITFTLTNRGSGAGNTAVLATTPAGTNTTKATGGAAITSYARYAFNINGANSGVNSTDVLSFAATIAGTLANQVTEGVLTLVFLPS